MTDLTALGLDGVRRCAWATGPVEYLDYHDHEWGVPVRSEAGLYERITLEAFQSGLSWLTILRKREGFRAAFARFDPEVVATYGEPQIAALMADASIVRNRRKIEAAIGNARAVLALRQQRGPDALEQLVWSHAPARHDRPGSIDGVSGTVSTVSASAESVALSVALKRAGFAFVGPTTMYAAMEACGLVDDHAVGCHRAGSA